VSRCHTRWGARITGLGTVAAVAALLAGDASAIERVEDGGFDQAQCPPGVNRCDSVPWGQARLATAHGSQADARAVGPICSGVTIDCAGGTSGYCSTPHWARVGAGRAQDVSTDVSSSIEQRVLIPAAPAVLRFNLRILDLELGDTSDLAVRLGGVPVFTASGSTAGYGTCTPVAVDVSAFAGESRILAFEGASLFRTEADSFEIDDVSLDAPDATTPIPVPPSAVTGKRAAALKACKKRKGKKQRRKCTRHAMELPV
jgi:hypothetical protein